MKFMITIVLASLTSSYASAREIGEAERVIVTAIRAEHAASNNRAETCVGFGHGLNIDRDSVFSELKRVGLRVHSTGWCDSKQRGLTIDVIAPIRKTPAGYELEMEQGDSRLREGEHFATLLRRGTYVIQCDKCSEPHIVSYRQTCCTDKPSSQ